MMLLSQFSIDRGGWRLNLRPATGRGSGGGDVALSLPGATGILAEDQSISSDVPALVYDETSSSMKLLRLRENTEYEFSLIVPLARDVYLERASAGHSAYPFDNPALRKLVTLNGPEACTVLGERRYRITGRLNTRNYVGVIRLDVAAESDGFEFPAEVVTTKITHERDFESMLLDLTAIHEDIILRLDNPAEASLRQSEPKPVPPHVELLHFRRLFHPSKLPTAVATILQRPAFRHTSILTRDISAFVAKPDMIELQSNPMSVDWIEDGPLSDYFGGYTPQTLPTQSTITNFDIVENRFVKQSLRRLLDRLQVLAEELPKQYSASRYHVIQWSQQLEQMLQHPFWDEVGEATTYPNSMVMIQRSGYRDLLQSLLAFDLGLLLATDIGEADSTSGDLKPIFDLYEIWCYFQLRGVLSEITADPGAPELRHVVQEESYNVNLKRGSNSYVTFDFKENGVSKATLRMYFNRTFPLVDAAKVSWSGSYSAPFHPDFSIEILAGGMGHWVHFDAKYKLDRKTWREELEDEDDDDGSVAADTYKRIDLKTAHAYRDAILGTVGSYILYPGDTEDVDVFIRNGDPAYRGVHVVPSVGAFPLNPSRLDSQWQKLKAHLLAVITELVLAPAYQAETGIQ